MEDILILIRLYGPILGAMALALLSAVSMVRRKHRRGALFGAASMASYMLFVWQWYSAFVRPDRDLTWFELAYLDFLKKPSVFRMDMVFLGTGLVLALANVLGVLWQMWQRRARPSAPAAAD